MLEESVKRIKNEPIHKPKEVNVEIGVTGILPKSYVDSEKQRMDLYRRLSRAHSLEILEALAKDITDAFGPMPKAVQMLFGLAEIKILAQQWSILSIITKPPDVVFLDPKTPHKARPAAGQRRRRHGKRANRRRKHDSSSPADGVSRTRHAHQRAAKHCSTPTPRKPEIKKPRATQIATAARPPRSGARRL